MAEDKNKQKKAKEDIESKLAVGYRVAYELLLSKKENQEFVKLMMRIIEMWDLCRESPDGFQS